MDAAVQPLSSAETVVRIEGLWSVFGKGSEAFAVHQDLDLTVRKGEMLALVGGSGTGKTVLLRQMLGLMHPARGSVTVLGRSAELMGGEGAASRVGMLFQHGALFSAFNVLDNIAFALNEQGTPPPLLLLDEPTAGLDPNGADEFCALVRELHAALGLTMVMVTHDLDTLFALATRVAVLADKKVIVTDVPSKVAQFDHPFVHEGVVK